jgi:Zn-dependent protease with chaperone function
MGFPPLSAVPSNRGYFFGLSLKTCFLTAVATQLLASGASAQNAFPDSATAPTSTESSKTEVAPKDVAPKEVALKKDGKYDVARIGERGIGHGFNIYSLKRERELGRSLAASFDRTTKVINDPAINDYINRLAQKIVRYSDADVPFTIKVIDSGEIPRAYGLPGGYLYVDSALILAADGEAELAGLMAHEIAHVAARHATRALTRKRLYNVVGSMAALTGPAGMALEDVSGLAGPLSVKKFSRDSEYEADLLGIEYAYAAGYDPQAFLGALEKMHALEIKKTAAFDKIPGHHFFTKLPYHSKLAKTLANYPLTEERIDRLHSEISTFLPDRKDYILDTDEFQEVKAQLLAATTPVLHHRGDGDEKGPVLRRTNEVELDQYDSYAVSPSNADDGFAITRNATAFASERPRTPLH